MIAGHRRRSRPQPPHIAELCQVSFDAAVLRIFRLPSEGAQNIALAELVMALDRIAHSTTHAA